MRAFFALQPTAEICVEIDRWRQLCWPGLPRPIPIQNLHITLAFLGKVSAHHVDQLAQEMASIEVPVLTLVLDTVGYWPKPDILWLGAVDVPEELNRLATHCKRQANRLGLKVDGRKFSPHITLARRLVQPPSAPLLEPEFELTLDSLSLVESNLKPGGSQFREIAHWSAGGKVS